MKIGRIPYINCYPVYGAIDRGIVGLDADLVDGVPTDLNRRMSTGELDISVVSAVEYARDSARYLLLPDLAISCDGAVRSVMLFSRRPASQLASRKVLVSRSSMTSVALPELAKQAHQTTGVNRAVCEEYLSGLDYGLSYPHLAGLTEFYRRLVERGRIPNGTLTFLPAA